MPGRTIETLAVATTSVFAGGALLTQTVIVPGWRAMDPTAFLARFPVAGPVTGATVFPFEVASVLLLGAATYSAVRNSRPGRFAWALATSAMVATLILVPLYFLDANLALLDPTFPPDAVPAALAAWYRWNWIRTGLGLTAAALACAALIADSGEHPAGSISRCSVTAWSATG
ncbi:MAG: DUF1772 domain-containing protein [Rhodococcus sp. (in: high G+C Gram-positive bacteria)]|nr:MAG: DUF1772 domain-containing protein [Rhodococcus sp. (in: high G+C Gram-positive bacteria)]